MNLHTSPSHLSTHPLTHPLTHSPGCTCSSWSGTCFLKAPVVSLSRQTQELWMRGGEVGDAAGASLSSSPQTHTISLLILTLQAELSDTAGSCLMRKEKEKKKTLQEPRLRRVDRRQPAARRRRSDSQARCDASASSERCAKTVGFCRREAGLGPERGAGS